MIDKACKFFMETKFFLQIFLIALVLPGTLFGAEEQRKQVTKRHRTSVIYQILRESESTRRLNTLVRSRNYTVHDLLDYLDFEFNPNQMITGRTFYERLLHAKDLNSLTVLSNRIPRPGTIRKNYFDPYLKSKSPRALWRASQLGRLLSGAADEQGNRLEHHLASKWSAYAPILLTHGVDFYQVDELGWTAIDDDANPSMDPQSKMSVRIAMHTMRPHINRSICDALQGELIPELASLVAAYANFLSIDRPAHSDSADTDDSIRNGEVARETILANRIRNHDWLALKPLLQSGASPHLISDGLTPLATLAVATTPNPRLRVVQPFWGGYKWEAMAKTLITYNADVNQVASSRYFNDQFTALTKAVRDGQLNMVSILLESGAYVNLRVPGNGATALGEAALNDDLEKVTLLTKSKADVNQPGRSDIHPLVWAAWHGDKEMIDSLIEAKADLQIRGPKGITPYTAAAFKNDLNIMKSLAASKADTNVRPEAEKHLRQVAEQLGLSPLEQKIAPSTPMTSPKEEITLMDAD